MSDYKIPEGFEQYFITGREAAPFRMILYGTEGIGKTTFASCAPNPFFIQLEKGLADIDVPHSPKIKSLAEFRDVLKMLRRIKKIETIVIDTIDVLERLVVEEILAEEGNPTFKTLLDIPYGKGVPRLVPKFMEIQKQLDFNHDRGQNIILISHCDIFEFKNPSGVSYHKYGPRLSEPIKKLFFEWADIVGFAHSTIVTKTIGKGFKERAIALEKKSADGGMQRVLQLTGSATADAKIRYNLDLEAIDGQDKTIELDGESFFPALMDYIYDNGNQEQGESENGNE